MSKTVSNRDLSKRLYVYKLGPDGQWSYGKNPVHDEELSRQFFRDIQLNPDGTHSLDCEGEICKVQVADAPSFVDEVEFKPGSSEEEIVWITLASGMREKLNPTTLQTGRDGALYCTDSRGLRTKFRRKPHLELASRIKEIQPGEYRLHIAGKEYTVPQDQ